MGSDRPEIRDSHRPSLDPRTWPFPLGGSKPRIPQLEFWNDSRLYLRNNRPEFQSREKMHSTARYLIQHGLIPQCFSAEGVRPDQPQPPNAGEPWEWSLRSTVESWPEYLRRRIPAFIATQNPVLGGNNIQETALGDFEREKLLEWAHVDQDTLDHGHHPAGETAPGTILVPLREWLIDEDDEDDEDEDDEDDGVGSK